jgi:hypothetical protein
MPFLKGSIYDLAGKPLVAKALIELDAQEGVSVWGGNFRLPSPAPPIEVFKPQCLLKLEDGRQGKVTVGRADRHAAYFLGNGKLEKPAA